jgi:hypothetical protein
MVCVWAYLKTKFDPVYMLVSDRLRDLMKKHGNPDHQFLGYFEDLPRHLQPPWYHIDSIRDLEDLPNRTRVSCTWTILSLAPPSCKAFGSKRYGTGQCIFVRRNLHWERKWHWCERRPNATPIYPADRHAAKDFDQFWSTVPPLERPNRAWKNVFLVAHTPEKTLKT